MELKVLAGGDVRDSTWWDMFAGTGAVGIEALSRGATFARLTDLNKAPLETIKRNLALTGLEPHAEVRRADAFSLLASPPDRQFDYIYIAPPQYKGLWLRALRELDSHADWLSSDGWIVVQLDPKEFGAASLERAIATLDQAEGATAFASLSSGRQALDAAFATLPS